MLDLGTERGRQLEIIEILKQILAEIQSIKKSSEVLLEPVVVIEEQPEKKRRTRRK